MIRITALILCMFSSYSSFAFDHGELWAHITNIYKVMGGLQNQITQIPTGKQGERGMQGIQGIPGEPGPRGVTGARGERGERGESGVYTAGDGILIEGGVIKIERKTHQIGSLYRGGIIFWLDEAGEHGLIASKHDVNNGHGVQWRNGVSGNKVTNARGDGVGAGEGNTNLIIAQQTMDQQTGTFAALMAASFKVQEDGETPCTTPSALNVTCFGGWYLPSIQELALLKSNLGQQGFAQFAPDFYWSSTEASSTTAWMQNFSTGEQVASKKDSTLGQIRAVSRF